MKVLIVSTTRVGSNVCVGGLAEDNTSLRLLDVFGHFPSTAAGYQVGQIFELGWYPPLTAVRPPHVEDVRVVSTQLLGQQHQMASHLRGRVQPWTDDIHALFDGKLSFTHTDRGFIDAKDIPTASTGFWLPDQDLIGQADHNGKPYYFYNQYSISYVGLAQPLPHIPKGTLVRVSLARWWRPRDAAPDFPERCYLQLSGWYL